MVDVALPIAIAALAIAPSRIGLVVAIALGCLLLVTARWRRVPTGS